MSLTRRYFCCHHLIIATSQFADMGRKVKELQAVLDKHVPDVAEAVLEIQPGETDSAMVFFVSRSASHDSVACSTQPDIFGRNPFWMRPSKYLFEHMYDVAMDARREKKIHAGI